MEKPGVVKAEIALTTGTRIAVEGTPEDVKFVLEVYKPLSKETSLGVGRRRPTTAGKSTAGVKGPQTYIRELKEEGFFETKQALKSIQSRLEESGRIYPKNALAATLIRLTKNRELRRLKEGKVWVYVNP